MAALTGVAYSGVHGNNAVFAEKVHKAFLEWWEKHGAFRPDWTPMVASEVAFVAAIDFMEKNFTFINKQSKPLSNPIPYKCPHPSYAINSDGDCCYCHGNG